MKDPRAFVEQCRAVWSHLSENEPENQVPPETLEERLALLVREVARRVVHLANYTVAGANPKTVSIVASQVLKVHITSLVTRQKKYKKNSEFVFAH